MKWKLTPPLLLAILAFLPVTQATTTVYYKSSRGPIFSSSGAAIGFSTDRTFSRVYREKNASYDKFWFFDGYGLFVSGANMTVTKWFQSTWLNYTVTGAGTQKIYPSPLQGAKPSVVYIDGVQKSENNGWTFTGSTVIISAATQNASLSWGSDTPPTYGTVTVSTTQGGQIATLSCEWTDDYLLAAGLLSHNKTGTWQNQTEVTLSGSSDTFSDTLTLPTAGTHLAYKFYAKDNSNQWAATPTLYLITTQENTGSSSFTPKPTEKEEATGFQLTVKVNDPKGLTAANAKVTVWNLLGSPLASKYTNASGTTAFRLPSGNYFVSAEKEGIAIESVNIISDKTITLSIGAASTIRPMSIITQPLVEAAAELIGIQAFIVLAATIGFILVGAAFIIGLAAFLFDHKWLLIIAIPTAVLGILTIISIYITPIF